MSFKHLEAFFEKSVPFNQLLGLKVVSTAQGRATLRIPYHDRLIGDSSRPAIHGGVISALADSAGGLAAWTTLKSGTAVSTIDLRIDYLQPAGLEDLLCVADVIRTGNRVVVVSMSVTQGADEVKVAEGRGVYNINQRA
ncbi:MAG: PaaI family thioesterase [Myxococcota bacterium]|nr:PaaI family thioesterase [Myxococcota bacterium]